MPDRGFVHSHRRDQALQSPDIQKRAGDFLSSEGTVNKASGIAPKSIDDTEFLRWLAKVADSKLHGKGISKEELQQYLKTYNQLAKSKGKPQVTWDEKTFKALAERSGSPDHVNRRELYEMAGLKLNDRDCLKDERFLRYLIQNHYDKLCGYGISRGELNQIVNQYNRKHPNNQVRLYVETFEKISTSNGIEDRISKSELENHLGLQIRRFAEKDNKQSHLVVKKSYSALLHKPFVDFLRQQAIKNPPPEGQITEGFVQNMVAKYNQTSKDQVVFDSQSRSLFARLGEFNQDGNFVVHSSYLVRLYREIEARKKPIDQQRKREAMMTAYETAQRVEELKTHEMATKPVEGGFLSWVFRSPVGVALNGLDSTGLSESVFGTTLGRGAIQNDIRRLEKEVSEAIEDARAGKLTAVRYSSSEIANKEREIQNKIQLTQTAEVIGGGVLETVGLTALTVGTGGATTGALATRVGLNAAKVYGTLVSISAGGAVKTGVGFVNAVTSNNEYSLEQAKLDFAEGALMGLSGFGGARLAAKLEDKIDKLYPKLLTNADKIHRSTDETPARLGAVFARSSGDAGANFVDGFLQSIASGDLENSVKNGLTSAIFGSVVSLGVQGTLKAFRINNQVNQFVNQAAKNWTFEVEDQLSQKVRNVILCNQGNRDELRELLKVRKAKILNQLKEEIQENPKDQKIGVARSSHHPYRIESLMEFLRHNSKNLEQAIKNSPHKVVVVGDSHHSSNEAIRDEIARLVADGEFDLVAVESYPENQSSLFSPIIQAAKRNNTPVAFLESHDVHQMSARALERGCSEAEWAELKQQRDDSAFQKLLASIEENKARNGRILVVYGNNHVRLSGASMHENEIVGGVPEYERNLGRQLVNYFGRDDVLLLLSRPQHAQLLVDDLIKPEVDLDEYVLDSEQWKTGTLRELSERLNKLDSNYSPQIRCLPPIMRIGDTTSLLISGDSLLTLPDYIIANF